MQAYFLFLFMSLGRGLDSLIPKKTAALPTAPSPVNPDETIGGERIWQIPPAQIATNPHQPRREFAPGAMEDLTNSIRQHGIVQPLVVTKEGDKYELIAGERRLRAALALELPTVPAIVREASASQKLEIAIIENVQRQDLNPLDEAVAYQRLIDEFSLTQEDVAKKIGKSRAAIANVLRLLDLPEPVQEAIRNGQLSAGHAKVLAGLDSPAEQLQFFERIMRERLTVRDVEAAIRGNKPPRRASSSNSATTNPQFLAAAEQLRGVLGTKVTVSKTGEKGTVAIEFYSNEDLSELVNKITGAPLS